MRKIIFIYIILSCFFLNSCVGILGQESSENNPTLSWSQQISSQSPQDTEKQTQDSDIIQNKIETIRKRLALKWLIIQWDWYYREWKNTLALSKYLKFYKENPQDTLVLEKIGDAYYNIQKYSSALKYYSEIKNPGENILDKIGLSISAGTDFNNVEQVKLQQIQLIDALPEWELRYYYDISHKCSLNFHKCKLEMGEYFWPEWESWDLWDRDITHNKLQNIKTAIENYRNFQVDQVYLKDAYIVAAWYSDEMYNLSSHMWEQILSYKPWYKPILKIVAQSYFEMWEYEKSLEVLWKYQAIDDDDPAVNYMLWIIYSERSDFILANIHLSKAISLWSKDSLEIRRKLIHNFYQLDNQANIIQQFENFIENEADYTYSDLGLGIYNQILSQRYDIAWDWSKLWQETFPEHAGNFYAYEWWILRETGDYLWSQRVLSLAAENFPDNPFLLINLGYTALKLNNKGAAVSYFKQVQLKHADTQFAQRAQEELNTLSQK